jgi:hypothetical protein
MLAKSVKDDKFGNVESDINSQFIVLAGDLMNDFGPDHLDQAVENFDTIQFDVFNYCQYLQEKLSLPFMVHKIFNTYEFFSTYDIEQQICFNFSKEMTEGYFKENPYHS